MKIKLSSPIVDLHVHSNRSDGSLTPTEVVDRAVAKGLSAFALTDHDTVAGIDEALAAAAGKDIEVIPGIELSTEYEGKDIHMVGLMIDYQSTDFQKKIKVFADSRELRNEKMCQKLQQGGIPIEYSSLKNYFKESVITRAHYARYMLEMGYTKYLKEAFERYIGDNSPYFVPREKVSPQDAINLILQAGGLPILAHPLLYHMGNERLEKLVVTLKEAGLMGIEAIYTTYSPGEELQMKKLADKHDLLISGGSDFHGAAKPTIDIAVGYGSLVVPATVLYDLKEKREEMLHA